MTIQDIQSLAEAHGLLLTDKMNFKPPARGCSKFCVSHFDITG